MITNRKKGVVKLPTIFSIAKEHGFVTCDVSSAKEKFKHLDVPGTVDDFVWPRPEDDAKAVAKAFASAVGQLKPNLCFIHFRDPDSAGHKYGAQSPEKVQALKDCDDALKTIKESIAAAGMQDDSVIILTADHGSHDALNKEGKMAGTHGSPDSVDVKIPWVTWGKSVKKGFTITLPVVQHATPPRQLLMTGCWEFLCPILFGDDPRRARLSEPGPRRRHLTQGR